MAQEEIQKQGHTILRTSPKEPRKYNVIILNDDFTTFEFVIMVMMTVFCKTEAEACNIAETTHVHQKATVGSYTLDIAKSKVAKATAMARAEGFPLKFEIQ
ncbi:MAG: ATP-dependent Clp protease adaptor ClpS [Bacteroidales bacterium]|jgi:ATP-dependent Clp protease adaptor protein ClpS|nr:ATP-dependent Clp protease adaptor ClpS [Bacteroidales bacterium]